MSAFCSDSGVDTVRFRWRTSNEVYRAFQRRPNGVIQGYRGEVFDQTAVGRVGVYPDGLVYLEGRASAILHADPEDHHLLEPAGLLSAERVALRLVQQHGAPVPDDAEARLGRADLAAELRFGSSAEGSAFLHALASLDVPWCKSRTDGRKGDRVETVSFHGVHGRSIYLRAYDKGVESGTAAPGLRIRVERQRRFRKDREPNVSMFTTSDLRQVYLGREFAQLTQLPYATVCDVPEALATLLDRNLSAAQTERLAGFLTVGRHLDHPTRTLYRRYAELRSLGIYVDPAQIERLEVPVGRYLQALAAAWPEAT